MVLQILVLFQYGGTSFINVIFDAQILNTFYISELTIYVKILAFIILINGISTGILWCLYAIFPNRVYGYSFNYALFVNDGMFDTFYCLFPVILAGGIDNDIRSKIGILQQSTPTKLLIK